MYINVDILSMYLAKYKNIKGARSHISRQYYTEHDHVIIGVGSNERKKKTSIWLYK